MTPEKVLFRTNDYIERLIDIIPKSKKQEKSKRENLDFALSIKSAIEKQIPKKPYDVDTERKTFDCPECLSKLYADEDVRDCGYCCICGQALDWSDTDD